jgi:hypothetical protein
MNAGTVVGGWEFVWAAYGLTSIAFLIYGVTLVTKFREEQSRARKDGTPK